MSRASFNLDIEAFRKDLEEMGRQAPLIMARALNRAAVSGQAAMVKVITADTGVAAKYVKRAIILDKASRTQPVAALTISALRIPLIAFAARGPEPSKGRPGRRVTAGVKGGRQRYPDAFIASMPNAGPESNWHKGVFRRTATLPDAPASTHKSVGAWSNNLKIFQLYGPSVAHVFEKHLDKFGAAAAESFAKNLASEISFEKSKQPTEA